MKHRIVLISLPEILALREGYLSARDSLWCR